MSETRYKIVLKKEVKKLIQKFPPSVQIFITKALNEKLVHNPLRLGKYLMHEYAGFKSWRVGKYRIVFHIRDNDIVICDIFHRKEGY